MNEPQAGNPPPSHQLRALVDRSQFIGDAGRTGSKASRETDPEGFRNLLARHVDKDDEHQCYDELLEQEQAQSFERAAGEALAASLAQTSEAEKRDVQSQIKDKEKDEAEKSGAGWRGPQPILGLSVLSTPALFQASSLGKPDKSRSDRKAEQVSQEILAAEARVQPELIEGLREIGLTAPLTGLSDPRLAGAVPALPAGEGWVESPTRTGLSFVWQQGRTGYQRLEWAEQHTVIETAVGERVQWLERRGNQITVKESGRENPRRFPGT